MRDQRAKAEGKGLPTNTCAPDLFTRIDALEENRADHADYPVRYFLGFRSPLPNGAFVDRQSWLGQVMIRFGPQQADARVVGFTKAILINVLMYVVWIAGFWADVVATSKIGPGGCKDPRLKEIKADIAAKELIGKFIGSDVTWSTQIDQYARNYICPTETLTASEALAAYLADEIDDQAVHDYGRAGNLCPLAIDVLIDTQQSRPVASELIDLHYRGIIDRETADTEARKLGWLKSQYVEWQHALHAWQPDAGIVLEWMRRGTTHDQPAQGLDLDRDFADAYGEQQQKWARALGLTEEQVRWLFRAQFQPVDLATAYDWFHRSEAGLVPAAAAFTEDDLQLAIQQSPLPPAYRALAYAARWQHLGIRQLKNAYDESLLTDDDVTRLLTAEGIDPIEGSILLAEWRKLKPATRRRKIGAGGPAAMTKLYAAGSMGANEYLAELAADGFTAAEAAEALQEAKAERRRDHRAELVKYLKGRYLKGEVDEQRVQGVLLATGLEAADVGDLLRLWRTEFEVHPRSASASELVGWYKQGLMQETELVQALAQLRYSPEDTARIIGAADLATIADQLRAAEKLANKAEKRLTGSEKEWAKQLAEAEKAFGKVSQRIVTRAGQLLHWVKSEVTGPTKPVAKRGPAKGATYVDSPEAAAAAAVFVETGAPGLAVPGNGVADQADQTPALPADATQAGFPPDTVSPPGP